MTTSPGATSPPGPTNPPGATTPPGTPNWVDLATPDLESATSFYGGLFGWTAQVSEDPAAGGYTIFHKDGLPVAGAGPKYDEAQPTFWSTYIATADADATAAAVERAGGKVLMAPFDVLDQGRMAVLLDPAGAAFSVWQPGAMPGAGLFNVPGALCWNELTTRDPDGAKRFYPAVFGWTAKDNAYGDVTYTEWQLGDRSVAGMMPMVGDAWPADLPPHWMIYFAVADADIAAARAVELGGSAPVPPTDTPQGRFAVLNDPQGAHFSVIAMTTPS
ncbi:MAG TPA: VOC family protein [Pilimelia sp.]|nr:VOC family protein [Pilimelia sp.]